MLEIFYALLALAILFFYVMAVLLCHFGQDFNAWILIWWCLQPPLILGCLYILGLGLREMF